MSLKNRPLRFFGITFLLFFILHSSIFLAQNSLDPFAERIDDALLPSFLMTLLIMSSIYFKWDPTASHKMAVDFPMREGEEILKSAEVGYILHSKPVQGRLKLTNQRLMFRYLQDEPPIGVRQLEADLEEISEVKLSVTHSIYRTGITVKVKDREHIFTVSLADRWVDDIRNVVRHGHTAN
ncbi:hypothetical protein KK062_02805 [Fulvivirgaceae bacterium PWU5]|uniref:GRAM domain-containing protein n=1 Tax=Dawidia cretensis TaxID=2782350 RepID=A0AAP2DW67_9BACT|nr:GRAM domain-containing protein [Dawidia cretensis]MBT1707132.1 hypothetical protein [Dawidia cretensis]